MKSSVFPIYLRAEYQDSTALSRFESDAKRAAQSAKRELAGVGAALEQALARPRNNSGSLDLGVEELRRAAMQQQAVAASARQVAEATKAAALSTGSFAGSMANATKAAFQLAGAEERKTRELLEQVAALDAVQRELNATAAATDMVTQATRRGALARQGSTGSISAERTAFVQLGQQLQDVTVQAQLGTSAFVIFGQQVPQAAFALMGLADSTNATKAAIGRTAAFLAGPWGAAIFAGVAVLGPLVARLFETEKAADLALDATKSLAEQQQNFAGFFDLATGAIVEQNAALIQNARLKRLEAIDANEANIRSNRQRIRGLIAGSDDPLFVGGGGIPGASVAPTRIPGNDDLVRRLRAAGDNQARIDAELAALAQSDSSNAETARQILTLRAEQVQAVREVRKLSLEAESLQTGQLQAGLRRPERRTRGSGAAEARRAAAEVERLANFGESAAERIARINEAFDESPRLIDRASQATRELDQLIAELGERKPKGFEKLVADAQAAKAEVEKALVRPFQQLGQETAQRLQIEELLAQGREDEATALQEIFRLEQQIGKVTAEQRSAVQELVKAEAERTRELRVQQRLWAAQLEVVDQVERSLTDLLAGRSTDFFGDFRRALADLQGQRLFEDLFGEAFRDIRRQLEGSTPQGRANARYAAEVEKTVSTTARVERALAGLGTALEQAAGRIPANDNASRALAAGVAGAGSSVAAVLATLGRGTITVTGKRPETRIARTSISDLAKAISTGIGNSIGGELEDLLGPRFASVLGDVLGGVIAGKALGGTPGGILGGLQGLTANIKGLGGLSDALGKAGAGAAVGSQVAGLSQLLGIKGSNTGAQIGGAIGSVVPVPGGQIIGAIAGNILGGLLKKTPRASATIGGSGGALGITGVTGTSRALRDAANGLGGSVLESINRIAEQLGASVNAGAGSVSIGQRKGNVRVDTSGRGVTKIGNGAVDFGEDAEAAVAFAVRDLIEDGVISGLKASEQRLLRAGSDIEASLRDVLDFRSVFDRLKAIKDPIGAALDGVTREFDRYRDLFKRAGADASELASLEELAGIERARAIEEATDRVVGSLKSLLAELKIGDNGLSLRDRQANALGSFNALASRVAAGDASAFDQFAEVSQQLLDIERQLFGSTQDYFDRLTQVTSLTERAIADQTNVTSIGRGGTGAVFDDARLVGSINTQTNEIVSRLDQLNANLIAAQSPVTRVGIDSGRAENFPLPYRVANF
jgi:hypothetical protein